MSDRKPIKYIDSTSFGCVGDYVNKIEDDIYPQIRELEDENKKLKAILKECCDYLNYPGSIRYIGEGSRLHMEMEEAIK
ncbi:MAG: hypothetical protein GY804_02635 [Alphaproteobacteria bacterium]|nr:hypothetical protein [Alphaproteobacteria bacterium]